MKWKKPLIVSIMSLIMMIAAAIGCESFSLTVEKEKGKDEITASTSVSTSKEVGSVKKMGVESKKGEANASKSE